ncbi:sugar ABC transporter permease [Cohnella sp. LGH]|uniref:Raffinose/stachyose/melibiose transport system permease protein n=1 Tax=Cohnella phaseoli TaxID=456490 RepID=A0A3D9JPN7_9BACL|nr:MULTISPECIES: sugar ABC transporter permease [Cohnella]QTH40020.1 sugar ABC transporter permease [Cohnella sp. LGH]RED75406.1 raffinose/stachyose/melibiose transport system permease protein [Cohnella phaseoli]
MNSKRSYNIALLVFTLPTLLFFTVIVVYPILQTFQKSFFDWDGLSTPSFIGFDNYVRLLDDDDFWVSLKNGLIFALVLVVYQIGLGTLLAIALSTKSLRGRKFFRTSYFVPVVLSGVVVSQLWIAIYNADGGLINSLFHLFGIQYEQAWLSGEHTSIWAIAFSGAWHHLGIQLVLIYTAIKSIPEQLYEAATIDGAPFWKMHWKITIPLLSETYKFCLVIAITGGLNAFQNMFVMTNGGPGNISYTLTFMMYKAAFRSGEYGYGSAAAAVLVLECLIFTILINKFIAREKISY